MTYHKKSIDDIDVRDKRVLVRCDFNVPQNENGEITADKRIVESLPTLRALLKNNAKVILCSHLGRPKGEFKMKYSLTPVAQRLGQLLGISVEMAADVVGPDAKAKAAALQGGQVLLLENVRFHAEEEKNEPGFAKSLAALAEIYVNDAFGTAHRAHASTAGVAAYLPAVCGYLIQKEINIIGGALSAPKRPLTAILGGAKVSDKIGVINALLDICDTIIIGGGMAYTFDKATGGQIGASLCEEDKLDYAREMMQKAKDKGVAMLLPEDTLAADRFAADAVPEVYPGAEIPEGRLGLDIGPKAVEAFTAEVAKAGTVIWNGPMGVFEFDAYAGGTRAIARALSESNCISIVGGGDSAAAVEQLGYADQITHISTGGGAALEFMEGLVLPGIACLLDK